MLLGLFFFVLYYIRDIADLLYIFKFVVFYMNRIVCFLLLERFGFILGLIEMVLI